MFGSRPKSIMGLPLVPRRSLFVTLCGVIPRALIWGLVLVAMYTIVPRTVIAMQGINPKLRIPPGAYARFLEFMCRPEQSIRLALVVVCAIDLPISYLVSNRIESRRMWGRMMMLIPIGIGLIAGFGFVVLYMQLIGLQVKEIGV